MKKLIFILFVFFLLTSCKKEPLTDTMPKLVGEWKYLGRLIFQDQKAYIEPYGIKHSVVFNEEGTYEVMHEGDKKEKGRIISTYRDKYNEGINLIPNKSFFSKIFLKEAYQVAFYSTVPEKLRLSGNFKISDEKEDCSLIYERK